VLCTLTSTADEELDAILPSSGYVDAPIRNRSWGLPYPRTALRQITDRTPAFDAGLLFDKILPLLMERTLEDRELLPFLKAVCRNKKLW
ncbi:hypothetical protein EDD17DRAFT_1532201, partial [Pisolithus thermaeus]